MHNCYFCICFWIFWHDRSFHNFVLYTLYYFLLSKSVQHCQNNTKKTVKIDKNVCRKSWKSEKIGQKKRKILLHCVSFDKLYLNLSVSLVFEKDDNNSQFPIVGKNQRTVKTLSKKKSTHMTQFNNSTSNILQPAILYT